MSFLDNMKDTLMSVGKDISKTAKETSDIAKMKLDIKKKESFVEGQYAILGTLYYAKHKDEVVEGETAEGSEAAIMAEITKALNEIKALKEDVLAVKGVTECPKCGAKLSEGAVFCSNCGSKVDDILAENTEDASDVETEEDVLTTDTEEKKEASDDDFQE